MFQLGGIQKDGRFTRNIIWYFLLIISTTGMYLRLSDRVRIVNSVYRFVFGLPLRCIPIPSTPSTGASVRLLPFAANYIAKLVSRSPAPNRTNGNTNLHRRLRAVVSPFRASIMDRINSKVLTPSTALLLASIIYV